MMRVVGGRGNDGSPVGCGMPLRHGAPRRLRGAACLLACLPWPASTFLPWPAAPLQVSTGCLSSYRAQDLAFVLWSLARWGVKPPQAWLEELAEAVTGKQGMRARACVRVLCAHILVCMHVCPTLL